MLVRAEVSADLTFILPSRELPDEEVVEAVEPVLSVLLFDLLKPLRSGLPPSSLRPLLPAP